MTPEVRLVTQQLHEKTLCTVLFYKWKLCPQGSSWNIFLSPITLPNLFCGLRINKTLKHDSVLSVDWTSIIQHRRTEFTTRYAIPTWIYQVFTVTVVLGSGRIVFQKQAKTSNISTKKYQSRTQNVQSRQTKECFTGSFLDEKVKDPECEEVRRRYICELCWPHGWTWQGEESCSLENESTALVVQHD